MRITQALMFATTLILAAPAWSADRSQKDPIDVWYEHAIDKMPSTTDMRLAAAQARDMWDKEMNLSYSRLMSSLDKPGQAALRDAQRAWLKYCDAEVAAIRGIIMPTTGTVWLLTASTQEMELVKARVLQLRLYEDAVSEH